MSHPAKRLVLVKVFSEADALEEYLNGLANDPANRYNLEFLTEDRGFYTAVFYHHAE